MKKQICWSHKNRLNTAIKDQLNPKLTNCSLERATCLQGDWYVFASQSSTSAANCDPISCNECKYSVLTLFPGARKSGSDTRFHVLAQAIFNHSKMPCMHACIDARRMVEKLVTPLTSFHQTFGIMLSQLCTPPNPQAKNPEGSLVPHSARLSFKKEHDQDQNQQNTWYIDHYTMSRTRNMQNTILIDRSKHNESETDQVNWCPLTILDYPLISLRILHESVSLKFLSCKVTHQIQVLDVDPQFQIVDVLRHLRLETSKISKLAWKLLKIC